MSDDELVERVRELIYDADPEIPAAAVVALCREAIAAEIETYFSAYINDVATSEAHDRALNARAADFHLCARLVRRGEQQ